MARPSDPDDKSDNDRDDKHLRPHPEPPIADDPKRPHPQPPIADGPKRPHPEQPIADDPKRRPKATPLTEGPDTTRVYLTGDDRTVVTERYIPTVEYGFRIFVDGQHFEQVAKHEDSGAMIFAPTR